MTASRFDRLSEQMGEGFAENWLKRTDRRYWALYRTLDLSQSDVMDFVDPRVDTSQATVSRVIRKGDTRALVDPGFLELGGKHSEQGIKEQVYPEEWYEAYRDVLATAVTDKVALETIATERATPEWAARRFPELVGCNNHHVPTKGQQLPEEFHETHLTHIESVNPDRWR